jgi:hypothetical protein
VLKEDDIIIVDGYVTLDNDGKIGLEDTFMKPYRKNIR